MESNLLQLWSQNHWRAIFNALPVNERHLSHLIILPQQNLNPDLNSNITEVYPQQMIFRVGGELSSNRSVYKIHDYCEISEANNPENSAAKGIGDVWVAPFVAKKENDYWIPLWIPAKINEGKLDLRDHPSLPWIPPSQWDPLSQVCLFAKSAHTLDDLLRTEFFNDENQFQGENWSEFYRKCLHILESLGENWREKLKLSGYEFLPQSFIAPNNQPTSYNLLLENYACIEDFQPKGLFVNAGFWHNFSLSQDHELEALLHAFALQEGEHLAVSAPLGTDKYRFVRNLSLMMQAKDPAPIYIFTPNSLFLSLKRAQGDKQNLEIKSQECEDLIKNLLAYATAQQHLSECQEQDEADEKSLIHLTAIGDEWKKILKNLPLWKKIAYILSAKEKNRLKAIFWQDHQDEIDIFQASDIETQLVEKSRALKVNRAKIQRELVAVVEDVNERKKKIVTLIESLRSFFLAPAISSKTSSVFANFTLLKFSPNAEQYWQEADEIEEGAFIIIDEAHRLLPHHLFDCLNKSKRALFLGDLNDIPARPEVSPLQAELELSNCQLSDEDLVVGSGNAFSLALANTAYQRIDQVGIFYSDLGLKDRCAHPTLTEYLNRHYFKKAPLRALEGSFLDTPHSGIQFFPISGKCHQKDQDFYNQDEAHGIVKHLQGHAPCGKVAIVTPFAAQKALLKQQLLDAGLSHDVFTFYELPFEQYAFVIFSPVYTKSQNRPFVFDEGEYMIYSIVIRSQMGLWVFGDSGIFDRRMHSPSGNLAKALHTRITET